jgi:hypothetical protein
MRKLIINLPDNNNMGRVWQPCEAMIIQLAQISMGYQHLGGGGGARYHRWAFVRKVVQQEVCLHNPS